MAEIHTRSLFQQDGFEHFEKSPGFPTGYRGVFDIPIGSGVILNFSSASQNSPGNLLFVGILSTERAVITQLGTTGVSVNNLNPEVRLTKGGPIAINHMRFSINLSSSTDMLFQWTDTNMRFPAAVLDDRPAPQAGEVVVAKLQLGVSTGIDSTEWARCLGKEPFHPENLPPIATPAQTAEGSKNDAFLTPASIKQILADINEAIEGAGERVRWHDTGSSISLALLQINVLQRVTSYILPNANPGEWLIFVVHPTVGVNGVTIKAQNNATFYIHGQPDNEAVIDPKWVGREIRAMVNKAGKWEILV